MLIGFDINPQATGMHLKELERRATMPRHRSIKRSACPRRRGSFSAVLRWMAQLLARPART